MAHLLQTDKIVQNWKVITSTNNIEVDLDIFINISGGIEIKFSEGYSLRLTSEEARELASDILTMQKGIEDEDHE